MRITGTLLAIVTVVLVGASGPARASSEPDASVAIDSALASPDRPEADRTQDERRNAREFLEFAGIEPGMRVLDAFAASGYYTELLSRIVGPEGEVIAYNNPAYARFAAKGIEARYAGNRLPNVRQVTEEVDQLALPPRSLDAAIFVMSFHDMYWRPADGSWARTDPMQMLRNLHAAMKVGGVVIVQDHVAAPGGDTAEIVDKLHRIDPEVVRRDFKAAGFALETESPMFAHAEDDHTKGVFDPAIRGRTDQFLFKFRRPGP